MSRTRSTRHSLGLALIAVLAVAALVGAFLAARALTGAGAPPAPGGLAVTAGAGHVSARWDAVDGATSYQLLRDDTTVVYSGPATTARDDTVDGGRHHYQVRAVSGGMDSAPSDPVEVEATRGWGLYAPLIAQFPRMLPQAPDIASPWQATRCVWLLGASPDELGPSAAGSGEVRTVMRIRCATENLTHSFGVFWYASRDGLNAAFTEQTEGGHPVGWAHGTGRIDSQAGRGVFKIADHPEQELAMIVVASGVHLTDRQILVFVNSMPI